MLSSECRDFIERWRSKADGIDLADLAGYFDKFYTLYVIYNRLYAETTFTLWHRGKIPRPDPNRTLPDGKAAKQYVADILGGPAMISALEAEDEVCAAIAEMDGILDGGEFYVLLSGPEAKGDRKRDRKLLQRLRSANDDVRGRAVLEFIYAVRCNTLHGSKSFDPVQRDVLRPCIAVLSRLNSLLEKALDR